jgi:hypothetical protein
VRCFTFLECLTRPLNTALGVNERGVSTVQVTDTKYRQHKIFADLDQFTHFYQRLAMSVFSFISMGTNAVSNIDSYVFSSMQGTLESIKVILLAGRINDAYALLRKYYDSAIINVYSNLYLKDHFSIESFVVEKINNWVQGKNRLPEYRVMSQYIRASDALAPINNLLYADDQYKRLRDRCNDHTHYNFFRYVMINDNEIHIESRDQWLDSFAHDVRDVFILHLGYVFFLSDHYMMSSDHLDALECGMEPEENFQYWVAPFIQDIFDEVITPSRPDIAAAIKAKSAMHLA